MSLAISLAYLVAAVLFILGLRQLSSPRGARRGNQTAAVGMVIALAATIPLLHFTTVGLVIVLIGVQTFVVSQLGLRLGGRVGEGIREGAERLAGIVLALLGLVLLAEKLIT